MIRRGTLAWILGAVLACALLLGVSAPASAGTVLKIAADGDISDVDLHMTTHYLNRVVLLNVYDMLFALGEDLEGVVVSLSGYGAAVHAWASMNVVNERNTPIYCHRG